MKKRGLFIFLLLVAPCVTLSLSRSMMTASESIAQALPVDILANHELAAYNLPSEIKFFKLKLSKSERLKLITRSEVMTKQFLGKNNHIVPENISNKDLVATLPRVNLRMNGVPVLDQGQHGTCVIFASTAVIDAALGRGDYISQLCLLALGNYLEANSSMPSGWAGSYGEIELNKIKYFGVINKEQEEKLNCGGLMSYPYFFQDWQHVLMPLDEYYQNSENMTVQFSWFTLNNIESTFSNDYDPNVTLERIKAALIKKQRLTFGMILMPTIGQMGAEGRYKSNFMNDTWMMTDEIKKQIKAKKPLMGHELIIYGYDDNFEIKDSEGKIHRGAFLVRNSWGQWAGYKGDFFVTYDYFKIMNIETYSIISTNPR